MEYDHNYLIVANLGSPNEMYEKADSIPEALTKRGEMENDPLVDGTVDIYLRLKYPEKAVRSLHVR